MGLYPAGESESGKLLVSATIELALNGIIVKSKQLLLKLDEFSAEEEIKADELVIIQVEREKLLKDFFNLYPIDEIQAYIELVNQVVELDTALIDKGQELKKLFSTQLIKLKKGQKSAQAYQKF